MCEISQYFLIICQMAQCFVKNIGEKLHRLEKFTSPTPNLIVVGGSMDSGRWISGRCCYRIHKAYNLMGWKWSSGDL